MGTLYCAGFVSTMVLAGFAYNENNYGEMRALIATGILFFCMVLEKFT